MILNDPKKIIYFGHSESNVTMYSAMVDKDTSELIGGNTEHFISLSPVFYAPHDAKTKLS